MCFRWLIYKTIRNKNLFFIFLGWRILEFVMDKLALWEVSVRVLRLSPISNIQYSHLTQHPLMLRRLEQLWASLVERIYSTLFFYPLLCSSVVTYFFFFWSIVVEAFSQNVRSQFWCPLEKVFIWKFPILILYKGRLMFHI